jgi:hypothetical protein
MRYHRLVVRASDVKHQPVFLDADTQRIRALVMIDRRERVLLDQVIDRGGALMLDVGLERPIESSSSVTATSGS